MTDCTMYTDFSEDCHCFSYDCNSHLVCEQAAWTLKMRALTEQLYVDEVDIDEEGIAETLMDNNAIASVPRPGTSLKQPSTGTGAISRGVRCDMSLE